MVIPITLLTGYLGAGKTTLLNNILRNTKGYKVAVIVNDIGEINVDSDLIAKDGNVNEGDQSLISLQNGCICCTLKMDLIAQIVLLVKMKKFDHILIEASGVCEPMPIAQTISMIDGTYEKTKNLPRLVRLDNIVTIVDASRMMNEFSCASDLLKKNLDEDDIENLLVQQIEFCNTVVLNKVDLVSDEDKRQVTSVIKALQPSADIIESSYGDVDLKEILDCQKFSLIKAAKSAGWSEAISNPTENEEVGEKDEYGIGTFVFRRRRPLNPEKFSSFVKERFPSSVIRCKGLIWYSNDTKTAFMFEQSGQEIVASPFGYWIDSYNKEKQDEIIKKDPSLKDNWDDKYGDRRIELVFIGKDMDREKIINELDSCLD